MSSRNRYSPRATSTFGHTTPFTHANVTGGRRIPGTLRSEPRGTDTLLTVGGEDLVLQNHRKLELTGRQAERIPGGARVNVVTEKIHPDQSGVDVEARHSHGVIVVPEIAGGTTIPVFVDQTFARTLDQLRMPVELRCSNSSVQVKRGGDLCAVEVADAVQTRIDIRGKRIRRNVIGISDCDELIDVSFDGGAQIIHSAVTQRRRRR